MFAHSYSSRQSRVCRWNIVRSTKQYTPQSSDDDRRTQRRVTKSTVDYDYHLSLPLQ